MAAFALTAGLSYSALDDPRFIGARFATCDEILCVSWVMPVTRAWLKGARAGDPVVSVDGRAIGEFPPQALPRSATQQFGFRDRGGTIQTIENPVVPRGLGDFIVFWVAGAFIAALGALVLVRRPDLHSARLFGLFSLACSIGLAVGPAAGVTHRPLPLILMYVAVIALGTVFLPLSLALIERTEPWSRRVLAGMSLCAIVLLGFYAAVVLRFADGYRWALLLGAAWLGASVAASVGFLAILGTRQPSALRKQAWIVVTGFGLGMFPFLALTYIPLGLGLRSLLPGRLSIGTIICIPIGFAVAILQYEMLGIRRLIHRGLVYGGTGAILLLAVGLTFGALGGWARDWPTWTVALIVVAGALVCRPLERGVHRFIDRFVYRDAVDYGRVIDTIRTDLVHVEQTHGVAAALIRRLVDSLRLESTLLFLGDRAESAVLAVEVGPHSRRIAGRLRNAALPGTKDGKAIEFSWESNSMFLTPLSRQGSYLGHVLWGPKSGGEVFVADERRVIEALAPILTLVLEERALSERLRDLNKRLLQAEEAERRRIAQDLHDGPLQKAALLGGLADGASVDRRQLARELNAEIREICTRLRPSILDDLGLVAALDWLLSEAERNTGLRTRLRVERIDEEQRFSPDVEVAFFRVTQESINNIIKHAKATTITVSLTLKEELLTLRVQDDGVGFSNDQVTRSGLGLPGMRERVLQIGGSFEVRSEPGEGTELLAVAGISPVKDPDVHGD